MYVRSFVFFILGLSFVGGMAAPLAAQVCDEPGVRLIASHTIASMSRTYAVFETTQPIDQNRAILLAGRCRLRGNQAFLGQLETQAEWNAFRSRFGASLGGTRLQNIWVGARRSRTDGFVRWLLGNPPQAIDFARWGAWAINEPGNVANRDAVTLHALYPGYFNACKSTDKYHRFLVEFRRP